MKKLRKSKGAKRKQKRKDAEKLLASQAALMLKHPTECCVCAAHFERTQETVKTWMITTSNERTTVRLTCPTCWEAVRSAVEKLDES